MMEQIEIVIKEFERNRYNNVDDKKAYGFYDGKKIKIWATNSGSEKSPILNKRTIVIGYLKVLPTGYGNKKELHLVDWIVEEKKTPKFIPFEASKIKSDNFSLSFNKFPIFDKSAKNFAKLNSSYRFNQKLSSDIPYQEIIAEQWNGLKAVSDKVTADKALRFKPEWRLVHGMGNESIYENSITLHHVYGYPYLPGSSVKGITRSHVIRSNFSKNEAGIKDLQGAEVRALKDSQFCAVFGCPKEVEHPSTGKKEPTAGKIQGREHQGLVVFADAHPVDAPTVGPSVLTPQFPSFYGDEEGKIAPVPYDNPNPVFFMSVIDGTFQFMLAQLADTEAETPNNNLLEKAQGWLIAALSDRGIGGKTTSGFGFMEKI